MNYSPNVGVSADFSLTCQHPIEALKLLRTLTRHQKPVPTLLFLQGDHSDHVIERFLARVERLFGHSAPPLIVTE